MSASFAFTPLPATLWTHRLSTELLNSVTVLRSPYAEPSSRMQRSTVRATLWKMHFYSVRRVTKPLADEILADSLHFLELATHEAGSHVVRVLLRIDTNRSNEHAHQAMCILQAGSDQLQTPKYGQRLLGDLKRLE